MWRELDGEADDATLAEAVPREHHLRPPPAVVRLLEQHAALPLVEACGGEGRQVGCVERVAEREVVLLHTDDVREIRAEIQLEDERERRARHVANEDVVL